MCESEEAMEQLKKKYPDPRLEQVELDHNLECAEMSGNLQDSNQTQEPHLNPSLEISLRQARAEILSGNDKAKALLRQGSSEECKEALAALNRSQQMLLGDFEESATSLIVQAEDAASERTPIDQMELLLTMEAESNANVEDFRSLLARLPRNSRQTMSFRREFEEAHANTNRYLAECRATILAGGRMEDVEREH
ncbi:hypothetical protein N7472_007398 [Penicillium cf. griseofulvum]|uniref:Uncharacterized protein n=1 Tax=Penicillium cf. griseofulvum TaxID=2972120 RepID=A0A9W9J0F2_9EURO|nr:hypothetical protein N7472_007398 [Penicillium cf. griseofulvum]KAJ5451941.1 hypothetical protein N7445_000124 [Penicillium cf. griseofulvum]